MSNVYQIQTGTIANLNATKKEETMIAKTIKHLGVTPNGIETSQLDQLASDRGIRAIFKTAIFSASQSLLNKASQLKKLNAYIDRLPTDAKKEAVRESDRYIKLDTQALASAKRLACLHAISEAKEFNIEVELAPMFNRGSTKADIEKKAEFAGVTVAEVQKIEDTNIQRQFTDAEHAVTLAEELFYGAETEEQFLDPETGEEYMETAPVFVHPEACLKDLQRTRDWLLGWNNPDYSELGLLKHDIATMEDCVARFNQIIEEAGEQSREMDDKAADSQTMTQGVNQDAA